MLLTSAIQTAKRTFFTALFPVIVFVVIYKDYSHTQEYKLAEEEKKKLE